MKYFRLMSVGDSMRLRDTNLIAVCLYAQIEARGQQSREGIHPGGIEAATHAHVGGFRIHPTPPDFE
ncbi:hypothetical protein R5576_21655 (plasmid) [Xanthomonas euvesicatoria]|nr:hypothetical protein R5576_21655 [Xanthomonas euvesicatoria]